MKQFLSEFNLNELKEEFNKQNAAMCVTYLVVVAILNIFPLKDFFLTQTVIRLKIILAVQIMTS